MDGFFGHGWGMGFGWVIGVVFIAVVIWLIGRTMNPKMDEPARTDQKFPLDVLKERYAKGEIGKQEYEERKRDLKE